MKKLLSLLLMLFVGMSAWAGTIVFADLGLENGVQYLDPFDGGDFTVTFAGGANDGKYYTTGAGIRVYGNGTMTVAAKSGTITEITVTYANGASYRPSTSDVVNVGSYDPETGVWTGSASSVVFTRPSGSGHWRIQKVEATLNGETPPEPPTPTITEVSTIAAYNDLADGTEFKFIAPLTCVKQHNNTLYLQEGNINIAGNAMLVYGNVGQTYETTDVVPGGWTGKKTTYNNFPEVVNPADFSAANGSNNIKPTELDLESVDTDTEDWGKYVVAKNVLIVLEDTPEPPQPSGDEIVFDFNNGLSDLGLTTPEVGTAINLENPITYNGITMNFTSGGTATRIWNSNGTTTLRVYKNGGSLTFSSSIGNITEITIDGTISGTFDTGVMNWNTKVWSGNASSVTVMISSNSTINKITFKVASATRNQTVNEDFTLKDPETGYTLKVYPQTFGGVELPDDLTQLYDVYGVLNFHNGKAEILPIGIMQGNNVITDIIETIDNNVKKVTYYNIQGIESVKPFNGLNVVVTEFENGTKKINKVIKR